MVVASAEQQLLPVRRPCLWHMTLTLRWLRQTHGIATIQRLPEDRRVAIPGRLKRDPTAVSRPDREAVVPPECQPLELRPARQVVRPDVGGIAIDPANCEHTT